MNYSGILTILVMVFILPACSWGPLTVTHKYGYLPKVYIETPVEDLRFRVYSLDTISLKLKKEFN